MGILYHSVLGQRIMGLQPGAKRDRATSQGLCPSIYVTWFGSHALNLRVAVSERTLLSHPCRAWLMHPLIHSARTPLLAGRIQAPTALPTQTPSLPVLLIRRPGRPPPAGQGQTLPSPATRRRAPLCRRARMPAPCCRRRVAASRKARWVPRPPGCLQSWREPGSLQGTPTALSRLLWWWREWPAGTPGSGLCGSAVALASRTLAVLCPRH